MACHFILCACADFGVFVAFGSVGGVGGGRLAMAIIARFIEPNVAFGADWSDGSRIDGSGGVVIGDGKAIG